MLQSVKQDDGHFITFPPHKGPIENGAILTPMWECKCGVWATARTAEGCVTGAETHLRMARINNNDYIYSQP